jgi:hypothetical protein
MATARATARGPLLDAPATEGLARSVARSPLGTVSAALPGPGGARARGGSRPRLDGRCAHPPRSSGSPRASVAIASAIRASGSAAST